MAHWTDDAAGLDGQTEDLVRPYTITRGRTSSERDDLTLITQVTAVSPDAAADAAADEAAPRRDRLQPEHRLILNSCRHPAAVAEIAADLDLPVSVTKILIGDLIAAGRVRARAPLAVAPEGGKPDVRLLQAVRDGLRRI